MESERQKVKILGLTAQPVGRWLFFILKKSLIFFVFLRLHLRHMDVPRLGVALELELPAYATAIVTWDPSRL